MTEEQFAQLLADMAANEAEHKSFRRRLDEHDEAMKQQNSILIVLEKQNGNIERLTGSMTRMEKSMENVDKRLTTIEQEPADRWKKIAFEIIKYLVIAVIAAAAGYVFKGLG